MSSAPGRRRSPKRSSSTSTVDATSSSESVVWLITASGFPAVDRRRASSGDSVRRQDADRARRDLLLVVDEDRSHPLEPPHDVVVVDDVVADVDRRPVL